MDGGSTPAAEVVTGRVTGTAGDIYIFVELIDPDIVANAHVSVSGDTGTLTIYAVDPSSLGVGSHTGSVRVRVCRDSSCNSPVEGSPRTIAVTYTVDENPALVDSDDDGVPDEEDAFPSDSLEWLDTDGDGIGNNADTGDDDDGFEDSKDDFPLDSSEWLDTDGDGTGNNADSDDDNDGFADTNDEFPLDDSEWLDTDGDGIGNNADPDDDNDSFADVNDDFPLDDSEWLDTDGDGIGNNADPNDDNDRLADVDDPRPLDPLAPGRIFTTAPGYAIAESSNSIILSGDSFSAEDTFYVDGNQVDSTVLSESAVSIDFLPTAAGTATVSIQYDGHGYLSETSMEVVMPTYYPYDEIYVGGGKFKGYFNPATQSLYVSNPQLLQVDKYQHTSAGWMTVQTQIEGYRSMAVSPDLKHLYGITKSELVELDTDTLSIKDRTTIPLGSNEVLSDIEFDFSNDALLVTGYQGSGHTPLLRYNAEKQSDDFGKTSSLSNYMYGASVARSGDGTFLLFGENGLSPAQRLTQYRPVTGVFGGVPPTSSYREGDISADGSYLLVNNNRLFNGTFSELATVSSGTSTFGAAISPSGDYIVTADFDGNLHWYDTNDANGGTLNPTYSGSIGSGVGVVYELLISPDGLTVFVLGSNKVLVVPVWQITENAIGSTETCPTDGCGTYPIAAGVAPPVPVAPADPGFDALESPLKHISPSYALEGKTIELMLTGSGFTPSSVVKFDDTVVAEARYIHDGEIRAKLPALPTGTYSVTVDGHQTNAPVFNVLQQEAISPDFWAIGGSWIELIYNAIDHVLYAFDESSKGIYRIDLSDNSFIWANAPSAKDLTWCAEDNSLYVVTNDSLQSYDSTTLAGISTVATTGGDRIECVAEGNIVITRENQHQYYFVWNSDDWTISSSRDFAGYPSGSLYSPTVDGVSARGDLVVIGESGISSPDLALLRPQFPSQAVINNASNGYTKSKWRADSSLGIMNNHYIYSHSMSLVGNLAPALSLASAVSPYGTTIFRETDNTLIEEIVLDPGNLSDFTVDKTHAIAGNIGSARRMAVSLDGRTVFIAGTNGISSISVD